MKNDKSQAPFPFAIFGGIIVVLLVIFLYINDRFPVKVQRPEEARRELTSAEIAEVERKEKEEVRQRIIQREEEEKKQKEEDARFYKTKAGRIHKKNPEWSRYDCERLADGKIWIGMTYSMLKYTNGLPDHANPSNYGNGTQWQWCWDDFTPSCYYDNDDDGVIDSYN